MPGVGSGDLYALAVQYRDAVAQALIDTPAGPPNLIAITPGPPAYDCCDAALIYVAGPSEADTFPLAPFLSPGHRMQNQGFVNYVVIVATILRCVPIVDASGDLPTAAEFEAVSQQTCADCWAVWNHIRQRVHNHTLFTTISDQTEVVLDPAVAINQQGGCGGWQISVRVALQGYVPANP